MANSTETITLEILAKDLASGNISNFVGHIDEAAKKGGMLGSVFQGVGQHIGSSLSAALDPTMLITNQLDAAGEAAVHMGESIFKAGLDGQAATAKLDQALKDNVKNWNGNTDAVTAAEDAAQNWGFNIEATTASITEAVVHTKNLNDAIAINQAAMDISRLKNVDLLTATKAVSKAYDGSSTSLTRMGIHLDKGVKGLDAVRAAEKAAGGQANTMTKTFSGQMTVFGAKVDNFQTHVGETLIPIIQDWTTKIIDMISGANSAVAGYTQLGPYDVVPNPRKAARQRHRHGTQGSTRGYAVGGVIGAGDWGIVGENGPEMIYNAGGGGIGVVPSGGGGIHVHFHTAYPPSPMEGERIAQALAPHLRREMARIGP